MHAGGRTIITHISPVSCHLVARQDLFVPRLVACWHAACPHPQTGTSLRQWDRQGSHAALCVLDRPPVRIYRIEPSKKRDIHVPI